MTSTKTFGGINPDGRNSSKVLKPPGGGSSDIFGTGNVAHQENGTPSRRMKNHQVSNLPFLSDGQSAVPTTPARKEHGKDTYSRLFGPPPATPTSAAKNMMKSNILLEDQVNSNMVVRTPSPEPQSIEVGELNGENGHPEPAAQQNGNGNVSPVQNGNIGVSAPRNRVPPGGYSSGLW